MTTEGVQLVKEHMTLNRVERCAGILKGFWSTFRGRTSGSSVKQEQSDEMDDVEYLDHLIKEAKRTHDDDQIILPSKCQQHLSGR